MDVVCDRYATALLSAALSAVFYFFLVMLNVVSGG
jgi:hypothetical protein